MPLRSTELQTNTLLHEFIMGFSTTFTLAMSLLFLVTLGYFGWFERLLNTLDTLLLVEPVYNTNFVIQKKAPYKITCDEHLAIQIRV
jgi:hypothetical protein